MRMDGVAVVLADEDDRQALQRRKVETLVEDAFFRRPIAKKTGHERIFPLAFQGIRVADGVGNGRADDGRGPHHSHGGIDEVHRASFTAGAAGGLAIQLGDHLHQVASFGQVQRMTAVGAEYDVLGRQCLANGDRDGLLADGKMDRTLDLVGRVNFGDLFLNASNAVKRSVE